MKRLLQNKMSIFGNTFLNFAPSSLNHVPLPILAPRISPVSILQQSVDLVSTSWFWNWKVIACSFHDHIISPKPGVRRHLEVGTSLSFLLWLLVKLALTPCICFFIVYLWLAKSRLKVKIDIESDCRTKWPFGSTLSCQITTDLELWTIHVLWSLVSTVSSIICSKLLWRICRECSHCPKSIVVIVTVSLSLSLSQQSYCGCELIN